jgi:hypothetical protein
MHPDPETDRRPLRRSPPGRAFVGFAAFAAFVLAGLAPGAPAAADDRQYRAAGDLAVYLGLVPAALVRGHDPAHGERAAHGRVPRGPHAYHLVVAIFDAKSGERVSDAEVVALVAPTGLAGQRHRLKPMKIEDSVTYGGFVQLPGDDRYAIKLEIKRPGRAAPIKADFTYEHRLR